MSIEQQQMLVNKEALAKVEWETSPVAPAASGEVTLSIDYFALTANNITYAVAGDSMNYWQFFPAREGWGRIPVWGFGTVVASGHPEVAVGERFYGYYPMGTHLTVQAERVTANGMIDAAEHRAGLAVVYNQYARAGVADARRDAVEMLYRPLFMTSFLLADFVEDRDRFGATSVILTSASSKTSIGLALLLAQVDGLEVVGLTSPGNKTFVEGLGIYDRTLAYDEVTALDAATSSVVIDMAGNGSVLASIHKHFDTALTYSCLVGATHWEARGGARELPGPSPELFFAPSRIAQRTKDWGPGGLQERFQGAWDAFTAAADGWIDVASEQGTAAIGSRYQQLLANDVSPNLGLVLKV
ncbi:MAG: DUF2855 family protein [Pseudomonadota bacterium]